MLILLLVCVCVVCACMHACVRRACVRACVRACMVLHQSRAGWTPLAGDKGQKTLTLADVEVSRILSYKC